MTPTLIELENVSKFFGYGVIGLTRFPALQEINLSVGGEEPETLTLVGESGSGKSTLAKIMLRILRPTSGTVKYRGKNLWALSRSELKGFIKDVQPVFQDPLDTFNLFENVEEYLFSAVKSLLKLDKGQAIEKVSQTLEFVGLTLDKIGGKRPQELSGGELQRTSIARALILQPRLLVADEPVSMLDASLRTNILNLLRQAKEDLGTSIVYITHDLATASYIGEKIAVMYRGRIIEKGSMQKIVNEPLHPYTKVLLESLPDYRKGSAFFKRQLLQTQRTVMEIREMLLHGCKYINYCPFRSQKCHEKPELIGVNKEHEVACWLYVEKNGEEKKV